MAQTAHLPPGVAMRAGQQSHEFGSAPLRQFRQQYRSSGQNGRLPTRQNVGQGERIVSIASGAILALQGLARRDATGAGIAAIGGALIFRGATGHSVVYQALGVNTAKPDRRAKAPAPSGVHIVESFLINKSPEELYAYWRNFENFPQFMSHLESVRKIDEASSHWIAKAPKVYGGKVEWDAEITADEPNARIAWRSLTGADVDHRGSVRFERAPGDRGTSVRVELEYQPPGDQVGRWIAKLFGEEPEIQIRDDLRRVKRLLETGELPTVEGQPRGACAGLGRLFGN